MDSWPVYGFSLDRGLKYFSKLSEQAKQPVRALLLGLAKSIYYSGAPAAQRAARAEPFPQRKWEFMHIHGEPNGNPCISSLLGFFVSLMVTNPHDLGSIIQSWILLKKCTLNLYIIKVSGIPSGNKLIKTIWYPHMWRYDILTCEDIIFDNISLLSLQLH